MSQNSPETFNLQSITELETQYQQTRTAFRFFLNGSQNHSKFLVDADKLASSFNDLLEYHKILGKNYCEVLSIEKLVTALVTSEGNAENEDNITEDQHLKTSQEAQQPSLVEEIKTLQQRFTKITDNIVELKQQIDQKLPGLLATYEDMNKIRTEIDSINTKAKSFNIEDGMTIDKAKQKLYEQQMQITELSKALANKKDIIANNQLNLEDLEDEVETLKDEVRQLRVKAISATKDNLGRDKSIEERYTIYEESLREVGKILGVHKVEVEVGAADLIKVTVMDSLAKGAVLTIKLENDQIQDAHLTGVNQFSIAESLMKRAKNKYRHNRNLSFFVIEVLAQLKKCKKQKQQLESFDSSSSMDED
ncbi:hypothetical protein BDF20DRAFT_834918 [Mycotypha africana]|uniref:uncharacterized protein n=1 Tax=Mycotypha africana TaxID=64632 RepID=UPI0023011776|nr:uncharacterized protein BDF20DRAFT_834918 [Mycotypha africana]KAI8982282.1 hypothetical protein BDF20DRAFT_834918 [Mycotypha africana]